MAAKFQNKYRIESIRLQTWDYGWDARYFVTICTKNREPFFGQIVDGALQLSPVGAIADVLWYEIKNHAKNVTLGEFVVMPDHIHGIIILDGNDQNRPTEAEEKRHALSPPLSPGQQRFQNQGKNTLSSIVGSYKSAVTKHANRLKLEFGWQSLFYDHIIRDGKSFERISEYIRRTPANWKKK